MTSSPGSASTDLLSDLRFAERLANAADEQSVPRFDAADLAVNRKADNTFVTDADLATERAIRQLIESERPGDAIMGEEYGETEAASRRWVIDPIDGTANYLRGVPAWGTLISLQIDGVNVLGFVSAPALGRRWWAAAGHGAWTSVDGGSPRRISVSTVDNLDDASVSFQSIEQWDEAGHLDDLVRLTRRVWRDRAYGDIWSYMLLAEGRLELVAEFGIHEYDLAAASAIVTEAGGTMTAFDGSPALDQRSVLATNGALHASALDFLTRPAGSS